VTGNDSRAGTGAHLAVFRVHDRAERAAAFTVFEVIDRAY
jgi:hypothetical protein